MPQDVAPTNVAVEKGGTARVGFFLLSQRWFFGAFVLNFCLFFVFSDSAKYRTCLEGLKEDCKGSSPGWLLLVCCGLLKVGKRRVSSGGDVVSVGGWKT